MGDSSPAVTATIASSTRRRPSSVRPVLTRAWPCSITPIATRSRSPNRSPIAVASAAVARGVVVAAEHVLQEDRDQQVAPLDAVPLRAREQPLPAGEPAHGGPGSSPEEQVVADPPGEARGALRLAGVEIGAMGALQAPT